jgi:poly(3-hydroxybutyrate) depolymerase
MAAMMDKNRCFRRAWHGLALTGLPACLALAVACSTGGSTSSVGSGGSSSGGATSSGGSNSGGATSSGGSQSGGTTSSGGTQSGGKTGSGGAESGGKTGSGGTQSGGKTGSGGAESGGATGAGGSENGGATGAGGSQNGGRTGRGDASPGTGGSTGSGTGGAGPAGGSTGGGGTTVPSTGAVPSVGCGKTSTITFGSVPGESGTTVGTGKGGYVNVSVGGQNRGFAMRLPDNYDNNKPYWLIFGFHWNGGNSKEVDTGGSNGYISAHFGLQKLSNNGAFFVAPDGLNAGWGGDNLPFVDAMVKLITENYCIDTTRLYANGFSYGGGMSYAIACARAKVFRAVAIYEGAQLSGCTGGNDPIAYWQMAGTTDNTCTISMATPMRDKFAKNNGCTIPATEPPRPTSISQPHICTDYTGCNSGYPLRWCVHPSGHGNAIVDGTSDLYNSCATPPKTCSDTCKCTWVPEDVWKFFTSL